MSASSCWGRWVTHVTQRESCLIFILGFQFASSYLQSILSTQQSLLQFWFSRSSRPSVICNHTWLGFCFELCPLNSPFYLIKQLPGSRSFLPAAASHRISLEKVEPFNELCFGATLKRESPCKNSTHSVRSFYLIYTQNTIKFIHISIIH